MIDYYLNTDEGYGILCSYITVIIFIPSLLAAVYNHWHRRGKARNDCLIVCFGSPFIAVFLLPVLAILTLMVLLLVIPYWLFTLLPQKKQDNG